MQIGILFLKECQQVIRLEHGLNYLLATSSVQDRSKKHLHEYCFTHFFLYSASGKRREKVHHKIKIRMKVFIKRLANHKHYKNDYYQKSEMLI